MRTLHEIREDGSVILFGSVRAGVIRYLAEPNASPLRGGRWLSAELRSFDSVFG